MVYIIMKLINKTLINILIFTNVKFRSHTTAVKVLGGYDYLFSPSVIQNIRNVC